MNGIKNIKLIALDSNIFIYNLEQNLSFIQYTDLIFTKLISKKIKAVTNIVSLIEILSYPETGKVQLQITQDFYSTPNLSVFEIDQATALETARIRRLYKFRLPDAAQLATALINKAGIFITNDNRLRTFKELKVMLLNEVLNRL